MLLDKSEVNRQYTCIVRMMMLLLISAVALLVNPIVASARHMLKSDRIQQNLNEMFDLAEKCKESFTKDSFVEDVSHLTEGRRGCKDKFFCKVQDILNGQEDFCERTDKDVLVRTLKMYNKDRQVKCKKTLQRMTSTGYMTGLARLLEHLKHCIQQRNISHTN